MLKNIMKLYRNRLSNNILTLSGELVLTSKDTKNKLLLNEFDRSGLRNKITQIRKVYPDIKIDVCNGLTEIDIKFFAYEKRIETENFLEEFNELLLELVGEVLENEGIIARLNVFGKYAVRDRVLEYRYLNKKSDVKFTIVDEEQRSFIDKTLSPKLMAVITILAIIVFCASSIFLKDKEVAPKDSVQTQKIEQTKA